MILVEHRSDSGAGGSATALAALLGESGVGAHTVVCGDMSRDRGSGSVPALIAHHLRAAQALGLLEVTHLSDDLKRVVRRLDGARREVLEVTGRAVLSVEGSVAKLRRAPLTARLGAGRPLVEFIPATAHTASGAAPKVLPWRPPPRQLPPPESPEAFTRILELTGALTEHTPPRTIEATGPEAAALIVEQLRSWGYIDEPDTRTGS